MRKYRPLIANYFWVIVYAITYIVSDDQSFILRSGIMAIMLHIVVVTAWAISEIRTELFRHFLRDLEAEYTKLKVSGNPNQEIEKSIKDLKEKLYN